MNNSSLNEKAVERLEESLRREERVVRKEEREERKRVDTSTIVEVLVPRQPTVKIKLKGEITAIESGPLALRIRLVRLALPRPYIRLTSIELSRLCIPKLRVLVKEPENIRISTEDPLQVQLYEPIPLSIKLKPPRDISVRLLADFKPIELGKAIPLLLKAASSPVIRLPVYPAPSISSKKAICGLRLGPREEKIKVEAPVETPVGKPPKIEGGKAGIRRVPIPKLIGELRSVIGSMGKRPVCLILEKRPGDSYVMALALICGEIYRIFKGGKPEPRYVSTGLKDEIERYLRGGDRIFIVDDSESQLLPPLGTITSAKELWEKVNLDLLLDRLRELFFQDFGFIIFHVSGWSEELEKRFKKEAFIDAIRISSPSWPLEVKREIARICWGFEDSEGTSFDEIFTSAKSKFESELNKVLSNWRIGLYIKADKEASDEHEAAKRIVVECLARELGAMEEDEVVELLKKGVIDTECEFEGGRADVCLKTRDGRIVRFLEIETLYGRGMKVLEELFRKTILKYKGYSKEVNIVFLTGILALLFANDLIEMKEEALKEYDLNVKFYLLNIKERRLVPLDEVFENLEKLFKRQGESGQQLLSDSDVEALWQIYSEKLREAGINPQDPRYKRIFESILDYSASREENLKRLLEELEAIMRSSRGSHVNQRS